MSHYLNISGRIHVRRAAAMIASAAVIMQMTAMPACAEQVKIGPDSDALQVVTGDVTVTNADLENTDSIQIAAVHVHNVTEDGEGGTTDPISVTAGNISVDVEGAVQTYTNGIQIYNPTEDSSIRVSTGNISVEGKTAAQDAWASNAGGLAVIESMGPVTVDTGSISVQSDGDAFGITASDTQADVRIRTDGGVTVKASGLEKSGFGCVAYGVSIIDEEGTVSLEVGGDIKASGYETDGIYIYGGGTKTVLVLGDVSADAVGGVSAIRYEDSSANITVTGDLTVSSVTDPDSDAILVLVPGGSSNTGGVIEVDGKIAGNVTIENPRKETWYDEAGQELTDWNIEYDEVSTAQIPVIITHEIEGEVRAYDTDVVMRLLPEEMGYLKERTFVEKNEALTETFNNKTFYTVKVNQPVNASAGSLSITTPADVRDRDGNVAYRAGTSVDVRIETANGMRLSSVSGGKATLTKNSDGSYTLIIPQGGGVDISAVIESIFYGDDSSGESRSGGSGGASPGNNTIPAYAGGSTLLNRSVTVNGQTGVASTVTSKDGTVTSFITMANGDGTRTETSSTAIAGGSIEIEVVSDRLAGISGSKLSVSSTRTVTDAQGNAAAGSDVVNVRAEGTVKVTAGASVMAGALDKANENTDPDALRTAVDYIRNASAKAPAGFIPAGTLFHADGQPGPGSASPENLQIFIEVPGAQQVMLTVVPVDGSAPYDIVVPADGTVSIPQGAYYTVSFQK